MGKIAIELRLRNRSVFLDLALTSHAYHDAFGEKERLIRQTNDRERLGQGRNRARARGAD